MFSVIVEWRLLRRFGAPNIAYANVLDSLDLKFKNYIMGEYMYVYMEQTKEIAKLRSDVNSLKEVVERMAILMNRKLINELNEEAQRIASGEFLTEEQFEKKHKIKIR